MASVTLVESAKLTQDMLVSGVIESLITTNHFYQMLPFQGISGNALAYNREKSSDAVDAEGKVKSSFIKQQEGTGAFTGAGTDGKGAIGFNRVTAELTTLIGDAHVDGFIQATKSNETDQASVQIAAKAKYLGRKFQELMVGGESGRFKGLAALTPGSQTLEAEGANGTDSLGALTFEKLDEMLDSIKDKDGQVDYIMLTSRDLRAYNALLRKLGGASISEIVTLPSGIQVPAYRGVPMFRNDYLDSNEGFNGALGGGDGGSSIYAGTIDDGSMTHGITGLTAERDAGMSVKYVGVAHDADEDITRVKWYTGMALFSELGVARLRGLNGQAGSI